MMDFNVSSLTDLYMAEKRVALQDETCKGCECFTCQMQEQHEKCKQKCFTRCKKKKYPWTKCHHYKSI